MNLLCNNFLFRIFRNWAYD